MGRISRVALVGPPNSGKTTLFNWLTGRKQKVVNYAGSTVDVALGESLVFYGPKINLIDTPGTYSLSPKSQDEEVTLQTLFEPEMNVEKVIVVLDSTQISRQIHLVRQVQEVGFPVVVAVTMHDLHTREGSEVDVVKLSQLLKAPACAIDGDLGGGIQNLIKAVEALSPLKDRTQLNRAKAQWTFEKLKSVFREGDEIARAVARKELNVYAKTQSFDRLLLHPVLGFILFFAIMGLLFTSIYWLAQPIMNGVGQIFSWLADNVATVFGANLFSAFLSEAVITGVGAVLVFVPQIFILFLGISLLEDSGYLARAATLADRPLSFFGLNGRAFVPILSGFACAVPAIMAARSISSKKERWLAIFIIPFMTCSARLPVFALLLGFLFLNDPFKAGLALAALYIGGLVVGLLASALLNKIVKAKEPSLLTLELPLYRRPKFKVVLRNSLRRTQSYLTKTAPIILFLSILVWAGTTFPNYQAENSKARLEASYAAQLGRTIEPLFRPMGVDWRVGVGLMSAFAARETFVSSLAVLFNGEAEPQSQPDDKVAQRIRLVEKMREAKFSDGSKIFSFASVTALILFFVFALQCMSTTSVAFKESGSLKFAIVQVVSMNVLAYVIAVGAFQYLK